MGRLAAQPTNATKVHGTWCLCHHLAHSGLCGVGHGPAPVAQCWVQHSSHLGWAWGQGIFFHPFTNYFFSPSCLPVYLISIPPN